MKTDRELYSDFLLGDMGSFEELIRQNKNNLIYFIQRYVKDLYIAEDISQDVFAYILAYKDKYDPSFAFKTYLYMLAKRKAVDFIRKQNRLTGLANADNIADDDSIEDIVFKNFDRRNIISAINLLKPDYQAAIYLIDCEGMSYKNAAVALSKTSPQVKILIHRARKALGELVKER